MTHWFTSDLHLGHESVALVHRGARSVEQHDRAIVSNLLRCLQSGDDLYILGDLSLGRKRDVDHAVTLLTSVSRRVGYKHMHLIRGNHDPKAKWATLRLAEVFSTITNTMVLQVANMVAHTGVPTGCSSNAFDPKVLYGNSLTRDETHVLLYGHTHDQTPTRPEWGSLDINVGVDAWAYQPVSLDHIRAHINPKGTRA